MAAMRKAYLWRSSQGKRAEGDGEWMDGRNCKGGRNGASVVRKTPNSVKVGYDTAYTRGGGRKEVPQGLR
jgi:hypothetical protein